MNGQQKDQKQRYLESSLPIGAGFGVALGLVLMSILDNPGLFALGISIGLSLGITIGLALDQRKGKNHAGH